MKLKYLFFSMVLSALCFQGCNTKDKNSEETVETEITKYTWKKYRGVNVDCTIQEADIKVLAESGANLMRLSMPICTFMELEAPYAYNQIAFQKFDSVLDWGEKYGVDVLIDPHRYPGTEHEWTMLGNDPFFQDFKWHELIIRFWERLAEQGAKRGSELAGYDLLNEPQVDVDMVEGTPEDLNLLYDKLTKAIRKIDSVHTMVYALPRVYDSINDVMYGYHKGIEKFVLPKDDNIVLETHTYMPVPFTHQNIWEEGDYVSYPSTIEGTAWNREQLEQEQSELIVFSKEHPEIPILVGEFSSPRWTGDDGIRYLTDVIDIAETNDWSWTYHAFRENQVWDPEMSITDRTDSVRIANAPRWELLRGYFKKNVAR